MRSVATAWGVPLSTVQHWLKRATGKRLDRVDWGDRPSAPRRTRRTSAAIEKLVLSIRRQLKDRSILGEYGAPAIHRELQRRGIEGMPSVRTVGRILARHGVLDRRRRIRRPAPPRGWYLPDVAAGRRELDSFDTIEGLAIRGGPHLTILTGISLHGGLSAVWPERRVSARTALGAILEHWRDVGLPGYAQFDNDNRFVGPRQHPDAIGRVIRMCLALRVTPVFATPNETGFQAAIESFNARWQAKIWSRFEHRSLRGLKTRSRCYIQATRKRNAQRIERAPGRKPIPGNWRLDLQRPPRGKIIYLRRTDDRGRAEVLGHVFPVDTYWVRRLVRCEVSLNDKRIRFYALTRRSPKEQPLLNQSEYTLPNRRFKE